MQKGTLTVAQYYSKNLILQHWDVVCFGLEIGVCIYAWLGNEQTGCIGFCWLWLHVLPMVS